MPRTAPPSRGGSSGREWRRRWPLPRCPLSPKGPRLGSPAETDCGSVVPAGGPRPAAPPRGGTGPSGRVRSGPPQDVDPAWARPAAVHMAGAGCGARRPRLRCPRPVWRAVPQQGAPSRSTPRSSRSTPRWPAVHAPGQPAHAPVASGSTPRPSGSTPRWPAVHTPGQPVHAPVSGSTPRSSRSTPGQPIYAPASRSEMARPSAPSSRFPSSSMRRPATTHTALCGRPAASAASSAPFTDSGVAPRIA